MSMKLIFAFTMSCCLCASAIAQNNDPFGAGSDPFGAAPAAGNASQDPFGGGKKTSKVVAKDGKRMVKAPANAKDAARAKDAANKIPEMEARINAALSDETSQTFVDTPLEEALLVISQTHNIPIVVDRRALEEVGLTPDTPVRIALKKVSLRSFLRLMLHELELSYAIKDEVMQITTVEVAKRMVSLKMYPIPNVLVEKSDQLLKAMQGTVSPASWDKAGGPASAHVVENILVVSSSGDVHDGVEEFLVKLDEAFQRSKLKAK